MVVNNKFNVGDEVYTIVQKNIEMECPLCHGNGNINYNGYEIRCPECKGEKIIKTKYKVWEVLEDVLIIKRIKMSIGCEDQSFKYQLNGSYHTNRKSEKHLFKTKEEAEKMCVEYNTLKNNKGEVKSEK